MPSHDQTRHMLQKFHLSNLPMAPKLQQDAKSLDNFHLNLIKIFDEGGDIRKAIYDFKDATTSRSKREKITPKDLSFEDIMAIYDLKYNTLGYMGAPQEWRIQDVLETGGFNMSPYFASFMANCQRNFYRTSESACRTSLYFMLNECLTVMKATSSDHPSPPPSQDIKVYREVSFSHTITSAKSDLSGAKLHGCVDMCIGRALTSYAGKRRFQPLLLLVEAKTAISQLGEEIQQLLVCLATLRHSRLTRNRSDTTVYGVASDGNQFIFVTITHEGVFKQSQRFNITYTEETLRTVLGCFKFLLEHSASITSNLTPERSTGGEDMHL